jgi:hypothetical protein
MMQIDEFMSEPAGLGGDALLATLVNHVASREGPVEPVELEMIFNIIATLNGRASPGAMQLALARLSAVRTAQELDRRPPAPALHLVPACETPEAVAVPPDPDKHAGAEFAQGQSALPETAPPEPRAEHALHPVPAEESLAAEETPAEIVIEPDVPEADSIALDPDDEAATCPPARLVALARRPNPSERLCGMIVARGHAEALAEILRNPEARFAKSSLTTIVELAASDMSLREAMCRRADLSDMILDRLWPYLSLGSKSAVIAAGCARSHAEARVICEGASAEEAEEVAGDGALRSVADWARAVRDRDESLSHAMRQLDQEGRIVDVAGLLAGFAGIAQELALALMIGAYDRGAIALARLAGCDDDSMMSLIHLRGRAGARSTADRRGPLHAFARLGEDEARRIVNGCAKALESALRDPLGDCEPETSSLAA